VPTDAKAKVTKPIENIRAISAKGNDKGDVLPKGYEELRAMALDAQGQLYVANANKNASSIDVFGPVNKDGITRDVLVIGLITESSSSAFRHPFQLAFSGSTLYVSNQDTNVVAAYAISGSGESTSAAPSATSSYLTSLFPGPFYEGTWVASAEPIERNGITPCAIPPDRGGLSTGSRHSVRGLAIVGPQLFVSDEPGGRVAIYDLASGAYQASLTGVESTTIVNPVALAVDPQSGTIAIGSTGNDVIFGYDPATNALSVLFEAGSEGISELSGLAWTPDGTLLFASRAKRRIYALDPKSGKASKFTKKFDDSPECLLIVPN
jgi:DNA-binding beta-propeller fold protein YncE